MHPKMPTDCRTGLAAVQHCPERHQSHYRERNGQPEGDGHNPPPPALFFDLIRPVQAGHHGPSAVQSRPGCTCRGPQRTSPDHSSRIQFISGFRYQCRRSPGHDLLKGIEEHLTQFRSGAGECIQQKKQQQNGREHTQEIIESEPGRLSEDFILPAAATRSFRQLPPGKAAEAPQISHSPSLSTNMRFGNVNPGGPDLPKTREALV